MTDWQWFRKASAKKLTEYRERPVSITVESDDEDAAKAATRSLDARIPAVPDDLPDEIPLRSVLLSLLEENRALRENLAAVQGRSGQLLQYARDARRALRDARLPDPGPPGG